MSKAISMRKSSDSRRVKGSHFQKIVNKPWFKNPKEVSGQSSPTFKRKIINYFTGTDPFTSELERRKEKAQKTVRSFAGKIVDKLPLPGVFKKNLGKLGYAVETGLAAKDLALKVAHPLFIPQTIIKVATKQGITVPGSKYIGPTNPMRLGEAVTDADALAFKHDLEYQTYLDQGLKPDEVYKTYNAADERLLKEVDTRTAQGLAAYLGMKAKQVFLPKMKDDILANE